MALTSSRVTNRPIPAPEAWRLASGARKNRSNNCSGGSPPSPGPWSATRTSTPSSTARADVVTDVPPGCTWRHCREDCASPVEEELLAKDRRQVGSIASSKVCVGQGRSSSTARRRMCPTRSGSSAQFDPRPRLGSGPADPRSGGAGGRPPRRCRRARARWRTVHRRTPLAQDPAHPEDGRDRRSEFVADDPGEGITDDAPPALCLVPFGEVLGGRLEPGGEVGARDASRSAMRLQPAAPPPSGNNTQPATSR